MGGGRLRDEGLAIHKRGNAKIEIICEFANFLYFFFVVDGFSR